MGKSEVWNHVFLAIIKFYCRELLYQVYPLTFEFKQLPEESPKLFHLWNVNLIYFNANKNSYDCWGILTNIVFYISGILLKLFHCKKVMAFNVNAKDKYTRE